MSEDITPNEALDQIRASTEPTGHDIRRSLSHLLEQGFPDDARAAFKKKFDDIAYDITVRTVIQFEGKSRTRSFLFCLRNG